MIRRTLSVIVFVGAAVSLSPPARAYQCVHEDARTRLARSDGAVIGALTSRAVDVFTASRPVDSRFTVDEAVKGRFGREVMVRNQGLAIRLGQTVGLFLERRGQLWTAGVCSDVDPDLLRRAAAPIPDPDSHGPVSILVGVRLGENRAIALDRDGGVVAYGSGEGSVASLAVCDGSRRVAEAVFHPTSRTGEIAVRDVATLELIRHWRVEELDGWYPSALSCRDRQGNDIFVGGHGDAALRVVRLRKGESKVMYDGPGRALSFSPRRDVAYMAAPRSIVELDMDSGGTHTVANVPLTPISVVPNADDSALAGTNGGSGPKGRVFTVDRRSGSVSLGKPASYGIPIWLSRSVFVVDPSEGTARSFDVRARPQVFRDQLGHPVAAGGGMLFSVTAGSLTASRSGTAQLVRSFDDAQIRALAYVPDGPIRRFLPGDVHPVALASVLAVLTIIFLLGLRHAALNRK